MRRDNVVLVGFMGAGKSVCGRLLARRLGRCFVETDDMIVAREGRSIPEIFRDEGEERFRQLETETLDALTLKSGDVIATGTPPGVGLGMKPPVWLQPGDVCRMEITGLGVLENPVKDA